MALTATMALDVRQFEAGLARASGALEGFAERAVRNANRDLTRMLNEFGGQRIVAEAARMEEAVRRIGGPAALTTQEMQRVNATVTEAIAKYEKLGEEAPASLLKLQRETAGANEKTSVLSRGVQALVAAFSVRAIVNATRDVLDFTGSLTDLAGKTGIGVEALQRLGYVTAQSGVTLEQVAAGAVRLGRSLVTGDASAVAAVQALKLNVDDLIAAGPEQAFLQIGAAVARVPNPMEQAALATALFGRAGADYLPAFTADMADAAASAPYLKDALVSAGDGAGDALTRLSSAGRILTAEVILPMAPAIRMVAEWIGSALPAALQAARDGINWLLRSGLEFRVWLTDMAVSIAQTVRDVPILGRAFGQAAGDLDFLKSEAQFARDMLNSFNVQGVQPVQQVVRQTTPLVTTFGEEMASAGRKATTAGQAIINDFIGPLQTEQTLVTRAINETGQLTRKLEEWARVNGATLAPSIREVNSALLEQLSSVSLVENGWAQFPAAVSQSTTTAGGGIGAFFNQVLGGAEGFGQSISGIFQAAFTGGGGALGAVQSFATQALSGLLNMIPGVGQFVSAFAGPIVAMFSRLIGRARDFFRELFGGPSQAERNDRNAVRDWEDSIIEAFGSAEDGAERWQQVLGAANRALGGLGYTADEIADIIGRLWRSSQEGGEETWRVIDELNRMMAGGARATAAATVDGIQAISEAISRVPTERRIRFTAEYDGSALPDSGEGYRTGTLGVHGSYFRNFGRGMAAVLHGQEAVVTARQAPDFAQRVLAETSGGARRDVVRMREDGSQTLLVSVLRALPMDIKLAIREGMAMA